MKLKHQEGLVDITNESEVLELSKNHYNLSLEYNTHRELASYHEYNMDVMIASNMPKFREKRNNIGYETARVMLLELDDPDGEIKENFKKYKFHSAKYKGLEEVMRSLQGQISLIQSLIKNRRENA